MQVFVSLTTIPARIDKLGPVIASLLQQTHSVTQIIVNVPRIYKAWPAVNIPPFLIHNTRVCVNRDCVDDGPATKVLGAIGRVPQQALLIYVDDDHVYPPEFVGAHVRAHQICPRTVFATRGSVFEHNTRTLVFEPWFTLVHTADGVQGVSVRMADVKWGMLAKKVRQWIDEDPAAFASDDLVLSLLYHEQGLTIRIAPCVKQAIPLKQAGDAFALCNGRDGTILPTTERYLQLLQGHSLPKLTIDTFISIRDQLPSAQTTTDVGVAIFAYQRPELLERVLQSFVTNPWYKNHQPPVYLFMDGVLHPHTGTWEGQAALWQKNETLFRRFFPTGRVLAAPVNYGVAVMQFWALSLLAARYEYIIMLEDDLILGPAYLDTLWNLRTFCEGPVSSVQAGYRQEHGNPHLLKITEAAQHHVHYWGWLTTARVWARVADVYTTAMQELFAGQYYRHRNLEKIKAWFAAHGIQDRGYYSQDWVRDACFQIAEMPFKLYTPCRRGVPIGRNGLHCNSTLFDQMGLNDSVADVLQTPALELQKAILTWDMPVGVMQPACASMLKEKTVQGSQRGLRYIYKLYEPLRAQLKTLFRLYSELRSNP